MSGQDPKDFERQSRALFQDSVDGLDMRIRSRLTQARHAALATAAGRAPRARWMTWAPVSGAAAALVLGVTLWMGQGSSDRLLATTDGGSGFEDLEMVASNDQLELLQDDIEFYDWIDKPPASDPAGAG